MLYEEKFLDMDVMSELDQVAKKLKFILKSFAPEEFVPLSAQERRVSPAEPPLMGSVSQNI